MTAQEHGQLATVGVTRFEIDHLRNFVVLLDHYPTMKDAAGELQKWIEDKTSRPAIFDGVRANSPSGDTAEMTDRMSEWLNPKRLAAVAVQRLADSEPTDDSIEGMERLRGTPQESMFVVDATELQRVIECTLEDAIYDASPASPVTPSADTPLGELLDRFDLAARRDTSYRLSGEYEEARQAIESAFSKLSDKLGEAGGAIHDQMDAIAALRLENQRLREELDDSIDRYAGVCVSCKSLAVVFGVCRGCGFRQREAPELIESLRSSSPTPEEAALACRVIEAACGDSELRYEDNSPVTMLYKRLRSLSSPETPKNQDVPFLSAPPEI